jgi:hypothetical protein
MKLVVPSLRRRWRGGSGARGSSGARVLLLVFLARFLGTRRVARRRHSTDRRRGADLLAEDDEAHAEGDEQAERLEQAVASASRRPPPAVPASVHALHATTVPIVDGCGDLQR